MSGKAQKRLRAFAKTMGDEKATKLMKVNYRAVPRTKRAQLMKEMKLHNEDWRKNHVEHKTEIVEEGASQIPTRAEAEERAQAPA